MTELKDGIKKIIEKWLDAKGYQITVDNYSKIQTVSNAKISDFETTITIIEARQRKEEQMVDDLAQRIADALVVDEDELNKITCDACGCGYCDTCRRIIKAISNAKPIKCEVGE
jgi:hypothetical protein